MYTLESDLQYSSPYSSCAGTLLLYSYTRTDGFAHILSEITNSFVRGSVFVPGTFNHWSIAPTFYPSVINRGCFRIKKLTVTAKSSRQNGPSVHSVSQFPVF